MSANADASDRRARRARELTFMKARSFEEYEEQGIQFWRRAPLAEKFDAIVQLTRDSWYLEAKRAAGRPKDLADLHMLEKFK
jgi:hypothetical protein